MDDPISLPEGSHFITSQDFDEYRIEIFVRPDRLVHFVLRPKKYGGDGRRFLGKMFARANRLSVKAIGKPVDRYSIEE